MDNCSIHHVAPALEVLEDAGILTMFIPPYSPDFNPIEELFSYVEYYLKQHDEILQGVSDPKPIIRAAFNNVEKEDCMGWMLQCHVTVNTHSDSNASCCTCTMTQSVFRVV
jgi:hypothetical protein